MSVRFNEKYMFYVHCKSIIGSLGKMLISDCVV